MIMQDILIYLVQCNNGEPALGVVAWWWRARAQAAFYTTKERVNQEEGAHNQAEASKYITQNKEEEEEEEEGPRLTRLPSRWCKTSLVSIFVNREKFWVVDKACTLVSGGGSVMVMMD